MAGKAILPYYPGGWYRRKELGGARGLGPRAQSPRLLREDPAALPGYPNSYLREDNDYLLREG